MQARAAAFGGGGLAVILGSKGFEVSKTMKSEDECEMRARGPQYIGSRLLGYGCMKEVRFLGVVMIVKWWWYLVVSGSMWRRCGE